jgi:hypothetical protein
VGVGVVVGVGTLNFNVCGNAFRGCVICGKNTSNICFVR